VSHVSRFTFYAGVDSGTSTTKAVVIDAEKRILGSFVRRSGADLAGAAAVAFEEAVKQAGLSPGAIRHVTATGYGRHNVPFAHNTRTEIGCHGQGCYHYFPEAITVVDIGGQDCKIIKLDAQGKRISFKLNRKCAAGTGAFLEEIAHKLDIPLGDLNGLARAASKTAQIGSYCTVFTATEVLDRIRAGERVDNIVRGLFDSVTKRILEMDTLTNRVIMTGGVVAFNDIVAELLSTRASVVVEIAPHPQEMGAFGAALFALESATTAGV
jgi:predicted CoA-substrate-specific enzyme activase